MAVSKSKNATDVCFFCSWWRARVLKMFSYSGMGVFSIPAKELSGTAVESRSPASPLTADWHHGGFYAADTRLVYKVISHHRRFGTTHNDLVSRPMLLGLKLPWVVLAYKVSPHRWIC